MVSGPELALRIVGGAEHREATIGIRAPRFAGQGPFPAADAFASRVLTLPLHGRVRAADIAMMRRVFEQTFGDNVL